MTGSKTDEGSQFRALADQLPAVVWSTDAQLRFTSINGGALEALGLQREQVSGATLYDYLGTRDPEHVAIRGHLAALAGESVKLELEARDRWYETHVEPFRDADGCIVGTLSMAIDITSRKEAEREHSRLQDQLRRQQKLEAIGQLAGGLAHEINNPLQSIINFAQLIRSRVQDETTVEYAEGISHEVQRLASIVRNLQCLVHPKAELPMELHLAELVRGTVSLFVALCRNEGIRLDTDIDLSLRPAWGSSYAVQQVLINLLTAARDSLGRLPAGNGAAKWIRIRGAVVQRDGAERVRLSLEHPELPGHAGDRSAGDIDLSLSISQEIALLNSGELRIEAHPDRREFQLLLPLAADQ